MPQDNAIFFTWRLGTTDADAIGNTQRLLARGESQNLYRLRSWVIVEGEVRALLAPEATLETIAGSIWSGTARPLSTRWVAGTRACAMVSREIETAPVALGLVARPEQWPWSSAASE